MLKLFKTNQTGTKGFTLVELLVVIAIIGLLATVVIVSLGSARQKARDATRIQDAKAVQTAVELYRDSNGGVAPTAAAYQTDLQPYLDPFPSDPLASNTAYAYRNENDDETYAFEFTTEADGSLGAAGIYCATSRSIKASSNGTDCSTDEE